MVFSASVLPSRLSLSQTYFFLRRWCSTSLSIHSAPSSNPWLRSRRSHVLGDRLTTCSHWLSYFHMACMIFSRFLDFAIIRKIRLIRLINPAIAVLTLLTLGNAQTSLVLLSLTRKVRGSITIILFAFPHALLFVADSVVERCLQLAQVLEGLGGCAGTATDE